jgi:hypothetical protein
MYHTNFQTKGSECYGLKYMPFKIWKVLKKGYYFFKFDHCSLRNIDYIEEKIIKKIKTNSKVYLIIDDTLEGYAYLNFELIYKFVKNNQLENKVIYATSHLDVSEEYKIWLKLNKLNSTFFVHASNRWFWRTHNWIKLNNYSVDNDKSIWYCSMNNRPRPHRLLSITYLDYLNLLDVGIVSANDRDYEDNAPWSYDDTINSKINSIEEQYKTIITKQTRITGQKLPLIADVSNLKNKCLPHVISKKVHSKTLINLITETFYFNDLNMYSEMFITEKTWKSFTAKQIPIIIGPRGLIDKLRNFGFDVFDDIVDNSYDIEPDSTRLFSAINSLNKLITTCDVVELSNQTKTRREQNFKKMIAGIKKDEPIWKVINVH